MIKIILFCTLFMVVAGLKIHSYQGEGHESYHDEGAEETEHHHEVDHKHATSHQSVKIHHFHPVSVYIKKEEQHLLKHPVEIGGTKQKLKILHPETEHNHNHGHVIENHSESSHHSHGEHHYEPEHEHEHEHEHGHEHGHEEYEHYSHE